MRQERHSVKKCIALAGDGTEREPIGKGKVYSLSTIEAYMNSDNLFTSTNNQADYASKE